jgi:hypothetical protein
MPFSGRQLSLPRFRCCHETAIELKVLLANKKLMFHGYLVEGMDRIADCAQEGEVEDVLSTGTIEEDDDKLEQGVTNIAPTSLKLCLPEIKHAHTNDEVPPRNGVGTMRPTECTVRGDGASLLTERCVRASL